jgi:membrane-bound serine protease (ClpP class)
MTVRRTAIMGFIALAALAAKPPVVPAEKTKEAESAKAASAKEAASPAAAKEAAPAKGAASAKEEPREAPRSSGKVLIADVEGSIDPGSGDYFLDAIERARRDDAELLIFRLDTPGGLLETTRDIVKGMLSAKVPIAVFVSPEGARAGSAGVFITLAAHVAAMSPTTNIGAAHPVNISIAPARSDLSKLLGAAAKEGKEKGADKEKDKDGAPENPLRDFMAEKIENDTAAFVQAIAEKRKRNAEWAISAVRESVSVTAQKALELNVIDLIADDIPDLLKKIDGRRVEIDDKTYRVLKTADAPTERVAWSVKQRVLHGFANPSILQLLMMLGILGILAEFYHPGTFVPGIFGAICMLLAIIGLQLVPVNLGAVLLILVAVGLFVAEFFLTTYGLAAIAGAVCLVIGSLLLVEHVDWDFYADPDFGVHLGDVLPLALVIAGLGLFVAYKVARSQTKKVVTADVGLVGEEGKVLDRVGPEGGRVFVHGEYWDAIAPEEIAEGAKVKVSKVNGLKLTVEKA